MDELSQTHYALAKQIPAMKHGCTICTSYGEIELDPSESEFLSAFVEAILRRRMNSLSDEAES